MDTYISDWRIKAAAAISEEQIDRSAAEKAFMDQAYAIVANRGKALFRDPFRLGFEIVDTNEKFTKMHAIFAFRCGDAVFSVPVFFVNGEVLGGDSVYRGDVKRFSPYTDKWCSYLVRKATGASGKMVDRNTQTQPDAYMRRLAFPQFGHKSASVVEYDNFLTKEAAVEIWNEMVQHSLSADEVPLLVPRLIKEAGEKAIDALSDVIGDSDVVQRYAAKIYANSDFTPEVVKSASADEPNLYRISDINMCKTAAQREEVATKGSSWDDKRTDFKVKHVTETILNRDMVELKNSGPADVVMHSEAKFDVEPAVVLKRRTTDDRNTLAVEHVSGSIVYFPQSKKFARVSRDTPVFGFPQCDREVETTSIGDAKTGKYYILVSADLKTVLDSPFKVSEITSTEDGKILSCCCGELIFRPDASRSEPGRNFFNDTDYRLLEVASTSDDGYERPAEENGMMTEAEVDRWMRTAGSAELQSEDFRISREEPSNLFSLEKSDDTAPFHKVASSLDRDELVACLAAGCGMPASKAVELADKAIFSGSLTFRAFAREKSAFVTRITSPETWITGYDPILGVKTDTPQERQLMTFTPQRARQVPRYGDHFVQDAPYVPNDPDEDGLPETDLLSLNPEQMASKADGLGLPHVLDHSVFSQLATRTMDSINQVRKYLPDIETGVDRYARILFLIRYRPAEFEQAYGKEETQNMEEELRSLFDTAGDNLLRLLKRFDKDRYSSETSA